MRRYLSFILMLILILSMADICTSAENTAAAPSVSAPSVLLMEKTTGTVIYEKNSKEHLFPASITKIMTMLLIVEDVEAGRLDINETVTASKRASTFGGSCVYLEEGEQMSVHEMLKCIAVVSANDCAVAMAEHISGGEEAFVRRMNERAGELGLKDTHFTNCTGLFDDGRHYTSAYDVALLSRELISHDIIKDYTTIWMDSIRNGEFGLSNTNKLVYHYSGCTGLKTGYTSTAGYCLSATAERDGAEYIAVVMHAATPEVRNADAMTMLDFAFEHCRLCSLRSDKPLPKVRVDMGKEQYVELLYGGEETALIEKNAGEISFEIGTEDAVRAPVKKGERLGTVTVRCGEKTIASLPLLAARDVGKMGFKEIFGIIGGGVLGLRGR